jgi:tetratricopeptide (TPR) repeat protein
LVKDELGTYRNLGEAALRELGACPDAVRIWYLAARSAEVLEVPFAGAAFSEYGGAKRIARDAAAQAPNSAPIATILARIDGTEVSAQRAYDIDPDYRPARRALALVLAKKGAFDEAIRLLDLRDDPTSADRLTRARVLLAAGRSRDAANEARKAIHDPRTDPVEPSPTFELYRDGNEVLGFALLAEGRTKEAVPALRSAAAAGSQAAQIELRKLH